MIKNPLITRKGSIFIYAVLFLGTLLAGAEARAGESSQRTSPPIPRTIATEANWRESIIVSDVLLNSLEAKLQNLREQAGQVQQFSASGVDESTANVAAFLNQRIESLERMARLIEKRQALQNAVGSYQQRLNDLQQKMSGTTSGTRLE
jgi:hypothetical protein